MGSARLMSGHARMLVRSMAVTGRLGASGRPRAEGEEARPARGGEAGPGNRGRLRTGGRTEAAGEMNGPPGTAIRERPGRQTRWCRLVTVSWLCLPPRGTATPWSHTIRCCHPRRPIHGGASSLLIACSLGVVSGKRNTSDGPPALRRLSLRPRWRSQMS